MAQVLSGGEVAVAALLDHGVDTLFGLPGVQTYHLFDALARAQEQGGITVIGARHEQGSAYMAFGYAQSTGRPGVYSVVPGPGMLNSSAALLTAYGASAPVLLLTGEVPTEFLGRGLGHLHEMPDQAATLRTLTKWSARADHPAEVAPLISEAFRQLASGRPRPVAVAVPWDVLGQRAPSTPVLPAPVAPSAVDENTIEEAAALLRAASNPMIMVGGGARNASAEVLALAEHLQAPVVSFRGGRGIVSDDHHLGFTCAEGFERWAQTDVLLGLGSRLELAWFRWPDRPAGLNLVTVAVDPRHPVRVGADVGILGDAATAATALLEALQAAGDRPRPSRAAEYDDLKQTKCKEIEAALPDIAYLAAIREVLPRDGFFVEEICQLGFASYFAFPSYLPRRFITAGHQGTLGFGYPTALGVKVANPASPVVSVNGDGGFLFAAQELATAVQYGINVVAIVFNNNAYGNVLMDQRRLFENRTLGGSLHNPDFPTLARSFGALAYRAESPAELQQHLTHALEAARPALIEVPTRIEDGVSPWRFLMPAPRSQR